MQPMAGLESVGILVAVNYLDSMEIQEGNSVEIQMQIQQCLNHPFFLIIGSTLESLQLFES
jgi:hypothetical protein